VSPVGLGDVFSFELADGRLMYMRVVAIYGDDRDNSPRVEVLGWSGPAGTPVTDPISQQAVRPRRGWDVVWLIRRPRDPDPVDRIVVLATGTPVKRQDTLPAMTAAWADLGDALDRYWLPRSEPEETTAPPVTLDRDLAKALDAPDRHSALRGVLDARMAAGRTREELLQDVVRKMVAFRAANQGREESLMLDAVEILTSMRKPPKG